MTQPLDDLARFNQARWDALAHAQVQYARPWLDLTPDLARRRTDPHGQLSSTPTRVLALCAGGGQQSAAFALLGAQVTVLDLSPTQLQRDRDAAAHYDLHVQTELGDMRDLSRFPDHHFDLVWHAHSLNFVPDPRPVFQHVARVLAPGGRYRTECSNPFVQGLWADGWTGQGYRLPDRPYRDEELQDRTWDVTLPSGDSTPMEGPREFRLTLSTVLNALASTPLRFDALYEDTGDAPDAPPGSWDHFKSHAAPWFELWATQPR